MRPPKFCGGELFFRGRRPSSARPLTANLTKDLLVFTMKIVKIVSGEQPKELASLCFDSVEEFETLRV